MRAFSPDLIRTDFPFFTHHNDIAYLDNAATTQKPQVVINAINRAYTTSNAPVSRGLYTQALYADEQYAKARLILCEFLGCCDPNNCVFTSSATASINLVANGFLAPRLKPDDEIWLSPFEHHANYLPWQRLCSVTGAKLRQIPMNVNTCEILWDECHEVLGKNSKFIAITALSNVTGLAPDIESLCRKATIASIPILIDGAQWAAHHPVNFDNLGCDFFVCSAHKMYGPNGIGLLVGKTEQLEQIQPTQLGGGMIDWVTDNFDDNQWSALPQRLEAGSPNLAGAIGFATAAQYIQTIGHPFIQEHLTCLSLALTAQLTNIEGICLLAPPSATVHGVVSFYHEKVHTHDFAQVCADNHIAIRAGHHCAQPFFKQLNINGTARVSLGLYNTHNDINRLVKRVRLAVEEFA